MGSQTFRSEELDNGITLIGEQMEAVSSAAFSVLVPVGAATDPIGKEGAATLLCEMLHKGAGPWDSRGLSEQFEQIGIQRSQSAGIEVSVFSGALLPQNLQRAIELYGIFLLEPTLPAGELDSVRQLALQDLRALEDEPGSKVVSELAKDFYPFPFGRCEYGTEAGINNLGIIDLSEYFQREFVANPVVIGVAGKFDWDEIRLHLKKSLGHWSGKKERIPVASLARESKARHLQRDTSQVQIALAFPSVSIGHAEYYTARVVVGILSGGMAGRLFIEVREKRGLVYRVSASHSAARDRAAIFVAAGTTPDHADECLFVMLQVVRTVHEGITDDELKRAKADLKSRLIMQSELSSVRASALVNDWWNLGRLRTLDEIKAGIDAVSIGDIQRFMEQHPVSPITMVTLGPKEIKLQ